MTPTVASHTNCSHDMKICNHTFIRVAAYGIFHHDISAATLSHLRGKAISVQPYYGP
jgi:hypothetical protein